MRIRLKMFVALSLVALVFSGCSTEYYKQSADDEVYKILEEKHAELFDSQARYEIEQIASDPMEKLARAEKALLEMPEGLERDEELPLIISHTQALTIATYNSRDYQSRKEDVYLTALSLTDARHEFSAQFDGFITSYWKKAGGGDETFSASGGFGVVRMLKTGAMIGIDISTEVSALPHRRPAAHRGLDPRRRDYPSRFGAARGGASPPKISPSPSATSSTRYASSPATKRPSASTLPAIISEFCSSATSCATNSTTTTTSR